MLPFSPKELWYTLNQNPSYVFQEAVSDIADVEEAIDRVQKLSVKLASHYCESEKNFKLDEFLDSFREFCEKIRSCEQELETWRVNEEKAEIRRKTQAELAEKRRGKCCFKQQIAMYNFSLFSLQTI